MDPTTTTRKQRKQRKQTEERNLLPSISKSKRKRCEVENKENIPANSDASKLSASTTLAAPTRARKHTSTSSISLHRDEDNDNESGPVHSHNEWEIAIDEAEDREEQKIKDDYFFKSNKGVDPGVKKRAMKYWKRLILILREENLILIPEGLKWDQINLEAWNINQFGYAYVYYVLQTKKVGCSLNGGNRMSYYKNSETIIPLVQGDQFDERVDKRLREVTMGFIEEFAIKDFPEKYSDLNFKGLSGATQYVLHALLTSDHARNLFGVMKGVAMFATESGIQEELGLGNSKYSQHEMLTHRDTIDELHKIVAREATGLLGAFSDDEKKILENGFEFRVLSILSWPPNLKEGRIVMKPLIMKHISGTDDFEDLFTEPANPKSTGEEMWSTNYTPSQRSDARKKATQLISDVENSMEHIVCLFDENKQAFDIAKTTAKAMLTSRGWVVLRISKIESLTLMIFRKRNDGIIRVAIVHRPLCGMATLLPKSFSEMETRAIMGEIMRQVLIFLRTGAFSFDQWRGSLIFFSQVLTVCTAHFHWERMVGNKFAQTVLEGIELLNSQNHGLCRCDKSGAMSKYARRNAGTERIFVDHLVYMKAVNLMSYIGKKSEVAKAAAKLCAMFKKQKDGAQCSADCTYMRVTQFLKSGRFIRETFRAELLKLTDGKISNLKKKRIDVSDEEFIRHAREQTSFWLRDSDVEIKREPTFGEIATVPGAENTKQVPELQFGKTPSAIIKSIGRTLLAEKLAGGKKSIPGLVGYMVIRGIKDGKGKYSIRGKCGMYSVFTIVKKAKK